MKILRLRFFLYPFFSFLCFISNVFCVSVFSSALAHLSFLLLSKDCQHAYEVLSLFAYDLPSQPSIAGFTSHWLCMFSSCCLFCGIIAFADTHDFTSLACLKSLHKIQSPEYREELGKHSVAAAKNSLYHTETGLLFRCVPVFYFPVVTKFL